MNDPTDERDAAVLAHFRQDHQPLTHDPFVGVTAQRVRAVRRRRKLLRQVLQVGGVATLVAGSRWLIAAAALVSTKLDGWFDAGSAWLLTPLGTVIAVASVVAVAVAGITIQRRRV